MAALENSPFGKRTAIMVAHCLSTVRHVDTIVFVEKGNVVENGLRNELLARNGLNWCAVESTIESATMLAEGSWLVGKRHESVHP